MFAIVMCLALLIYTLLIWLEPGSGRVRWCYVCVSCESVFFVYIAGPGICIIGAS